MASPGTSNGLRYGTTRYYQLVTMINQPRCWFTFLIASIVVKADEIWEQDLSSDFKIGISTTGYHSVDLKCSAGAFLVNVTVDSDFDGILYTRGDFSNKKKPCFQSKKDIASVNGEIAKYNLRIPFNKCHTVEDASDQQFVNTLVLQHDSELIMPGDAAFQLACAFLPEQTLGSTILTAPKSKIVLVDADPASKVISEEHQVESDTESVSFPKKSVTLKDEL